MTNKKKFQGSRWSSCGKNSPRWWSELPDHPAKFSQVLISHLYDRIRNEPFVVDCFAGTCQLIRVLGLGFTGHLFMVELQPKWMPRLFHPQVTLWPGNALYLPFPSGSVPCFCSSPCYGNRFSDHHNAKDPYLRESYHHCHIRCTGVELEPGNAGILNFKEPEYKIFHYRHLIEVYRCLAPGGNYILNMSNHMRLQKEIQVVAWWLEAAKVCGFVVDDDLAIRTKRMRKGQNHLERVEHEHIITLRKPAA
jgi:hypothetical protein